MTKANTKTKNTPWRLREAKNHFSQLVENALREGPQTITLRGKPVVVVVSFEEFQALTRPSTPLCEFFRQSPLCGADLDLERSQDLSRDIIE